MRCATCGVSTRGVRCASHAKRAYNTGPVPNGGNGSRRAHNAIMALILDRKAKGDEAVSTFVRIGALEQSTSHPVTHGLFHCFMPLLTLLLLFLLLLPAPCSHPYPPWRTQSPTPRRRNAAKQRELADACLFHSHSSLRTSSESGRPCCSSLGFLPLCTPAAT